MFQALAASPKDGVDPTVIGDEDDYEDGAKQEQVPHPAVQHMSGILDEVAGRHPAVRTHRAHIRDVDSNLELNAKFEKGSKSVSIADFRSAKSAAKLAAR